MITTEAMDPTTEAQIFIEDWHSDGSTTRADGTVVTRLPSLSREFVNTVGFNYSSDVLNLGDPFSFSIPNPEGRYRDRFQRGARCKFHLKNPNVGGGRLTLKHDGIVVNRALRADPSGCYLDVQCADLGWHLLNNDAPLWYVLQGKTLEYLLKDKHFIDPSWGIKGVVADNETTRLMRRGLNNGRAQAAIDMQALGTTVYIQVEPGDKVADLILQYCRRLGRLFTVSPDGYMQVWTPDENQAPLYCINFHGFGDRRTLNTAISALVTEDISSVYTVVTCIGENVGGDLQQDSTSQNAAKRAGSFFNEKALPFRHNLNFADGEIFEYGPARQQAKWRYGRGIFDSWAAIYVLRGHHQSGNWWEADTMCTVHDSVNGIDGDFYVQSVVYTRDQGGDKTTVTLRKPGLLRASYGVYDRPPRVSAPTTLPMAVREDQMTTTTTEAK